MASADSTGDDLFAPGAILNGKYRLDRELGRGGMGQVFAATNLLLDAPVAIKVLHAGARPSRGLANRFLQEARAAAQVRHPNIVSVLDIGQDEASGAFFIVQEFLQGRDLKRQLALHGPMPPRDAIEMLLPVMRALSFAHSKGVVHRDLKPDNIFLCDTPEGVVPKVIDFGIAKMTDAQGISAQMTHTAQVLGTPYYMSPEQARGDRAVDARADVWSLGVVLFHMLTRRHPHEGATANLIIAHIISHPPTPVTVYAPTLPTPVAALVDRALQYEASMRTPSMDAFWDAARQCMATLGAAPELLAARLSLPQSAPASQPQPLVATAADAPTIAPHVVTSPVGTGARTNRAVIVMGVVALTLVALAGGYASTRRAPTAVASSRPPTTSHPVATVLQAPARPMLPTLPSAPGPTLPIARPATASAPVVVPTPVPLPPSAMRTSPPSAAVASPPAVAPRESRGRAAPQRPRAPTPRQAVAAPRVVDPAPTSEPNTAY